MFAKGFLRFSLFPAKFVGSLIDYKLSHQKSLNSLDQASYTAVIGGNWI